VCGSTHRRDTNPARPVTLLQGKPRRVSRTLTISFHP
jgi:hypothetical protein